MIIRMGFLLFIIGFAGMIKFEDSPLIVFFMIVSMLGALMHIFGDYFINDEDIKKEK